MGQQQQQPPPHYVSAYHHQNGPHGTNAPQPPQRQNSGGNPNLGHHHHQPHPFNMAAHQLNTSAEPFIPQDHSNGFVSMDMDPNYIMYNPILQPPNSQTQVMGYPGQNPLKSDDVVEKN